MAIYKFAQKLVRSDAVSKTVVFCTDCSPHELRDAALFIGGFMILTLGLSPDAVSRAFEPVSNRLAADDEPSLISCWKALHHAHSVCGWLHISHYKPIPLHGPSTNDDCKYERFLDMDEFAHYDSPLNGGFHVVAPGKLIAFDRPSDLPAGASWADEQGVRRFSAGFYAELFADMDVGVVLRAGGGGGYDAAAFWAWGMEVEDMPLDGDAELSLGDVDRFLSLVRLSPGAVAVHGGERGLGAAGTLMAVWLMSGHGFGAEEAVAWVGMVHPAGTPAAHRRLLQDHEARARRRLGLERISRSFNERALDVAAACAADSAECFKHDSDAARPAGCSGCGVRVFTAPDDLCGGGGGGGGVLVLAKDGSGLISSSSPPPPPALLPPPPPGGLPRSISAPRMCGAPRVSSLP